MEKTQVEIGLDYSGKTYYFKLILNDEIILEGDGWETREEILNWLKQIRNILNSM